jgi:hypothetical protein
MPGRFHVDGVLKDVVSLFEGVRRDLAAGTALGAEIPLPSRPGDDDTCEDLGIGMRTTGCGAAATLAG